MRADQAVGLGEFEIQFDVPPTIGKVLTAERPKAITAGIPATRNSPLAIDDETLEIVL